MNRLIVNADDFGLTGGVNRGIIDCHRAGVVSSTTLMVNGEAAAAAAAAAASNPGLGVGLHLNITTGAPVLPPGAVPSLVGPDGRFPGRNRAVLRLTAGRVRPLELAAEIAAQIEFCIKLGVVPTHVDSHHHIHAHPRLRSVMGSVCPRLGITRIRGYRTAVRSFRALAVAAAARLPAAGEPLKSPDRFSGMEVMGKKNMARALKRELGVRGDVLEFMCHPGYADEQLSEASGYSSLREVELRALLSGDFSRVIRSAGVELVSYSAL